MRIITVTLSDYNSKYFPIKAAFTENKTRYSLVFENVKQARAYFDGLFYRVKYINKCISV